MGIKEEICQALRIMFNFGLITLKSGNVSSLDESGNAFWITPSGKAKNSVTPEDLVLVSLRGEVLSRGRPSIEHRMHLHVYLNSGAKAVIHSHSPYSTILGELGMLKDLEEYYEARLLIGKIGLVDRFPPGSEELAIAVGNCLKKNDVAILRGHGCVAKGEDLKEALERILSLEHLSKAIISKKILEKLL